MARHYRKKHSSRKGSLLLGLIIGLIGAWGVWNAMKLQQTLRSSEQSPSKAAEGLPLMWVETAAAQPAADPFDTSAMHDDTVPAHTAEVARPVLSPEELAALLDSAGRSLEGGRIIAGRDLLNQALAALPDAARQDELRSRLTALNTAAFLGSDIPQGDPYVRMTAIAPGDSFVRLGHRYKVPAEFIAQINPQLSARNLKPGAGIKVVYGPFHVRVMKRAARLDLYARDMYVRSYPISFDEGNYLPAGIYRVAPGGKIALGNTTNGSGRRWVMCDGVADEDGSIIAACIYGSAGPRSTGRIGLSGIRCSDEVLAQVYNTLIEQDSLMRVDP